MAASAIRNVSQRQCRTILAPILISFSRSGVKAGALLSPVRQTSPLGHLRTIRAAILSVRT